MELDATCTVLTEVFGLARFEVLAAADAGGELEIMIETPAGPVGCPGCAAVARPKDRRPTWVADLPIGGRPVVLCWVKRIWCCPYVAGDPVGDLDPVVLTQPESAGVVLDFG